MNQNPDWNQIIAASRFHSLTPLLIKHISEGNLSEKLPSDTLEQIHAIGRLQTTRRLKIIAVFQELSAIFREQNIEFILLKGLYLSDTYYTNSCLRPMQDIDFLFKKDDLDRVLHILNHLGASRLVELQSDYINSFLQHVPPFIYKDVLLEIHTSLIASNESYCFTQEIIWSNTVMLEIQKVNVRVFNPELNLIYIAVHLFRHVRTAKYKLIWFTDLLLLLSASVSFDPLKVKGLINETQSEECLKSLLFLLNNNWNFKGGDKLQVTCEEPDKRILQNFRNGILRKHSPDEYYTIEAWKRIPGIKNKIRFILGLAFPSVAFMKKKYKLSNHLSLLAYYLYNSLKVIFKGILILLSR